MSSYNYKEFIIKARQLILTLTEKKIKLKIDKKLPYKGILTAYNNGDFLITINLTKCVTLSKGRRRFNYAYFLAIVAHECGHFVHWSMTRPEYEEEFLAQFVAIQKCYEHNYESNLNWLFVILMDMKNSKILKF